ncbi:hypothetical protein GIB67_020379 [Kingdonia uniflora]|uniref:Uncharacterized protein n=1 Tax=Kingdonia uniflora TaxID=39325 RepID=A0A7J7LBM5_9MAGN|nr:hypothetical protein GIB67_020379 [Kingdonia uniflora]
MMASYPIFISLVHQFSSSFLSLSPTQFQIPQKPLDKLRGFSKRIRRIKRQKSSEIDMSVSIPVRQGRYDDDEEEAFGDHRNRKNLSS